MLLLFGFLAVAQSPDVLPDTIGVCESDSIFVSISEKVFKKAKITWITPKNIEYNTRKIKGGKYAGTYYVQLETESKTIKDSAYVMFVKKPNIKFRDTSICKGVPLVLTAKGKYTNVSWSNQSTSSSIIIRNSGTYWVKLSNYGCEFTDTFNVNIIQGAEPEFGSEESFCLNEENKQLSIKTTPNTLIEWSTGARTNTTSVTKEGIYWVRTKSKSCGEKFDSVYVKLKACNCEILVPNSFTPNEDNKNDNFFPVLQCEYTYYSFTVFDKWGNQIYSTNSTNGKWDGRYKGHLCDEDIYVYKIETKEKGSEKKTLRSGKVSLIR